MQTFSGMQRSLSYQNVINRLVLVGFYVFYISMSSLYLLVPPLLAVLFYLYHDALRKNDLFGLSIVALMLLVFEAEKGFWFGSTILFYTFLSLYVLPRLELTIQCTLCLKGIMVLMAYPGYWIFMWFINYLLLLSVPALDWHILLYIIIEFLVIAAML